MIEILYAILDIRQQQIRAIAVCLCLMCVFSNIFLVFLLFQKLVL